jgi:hypothetical protein
MSEQPPGARRGLEIAILVVAWALLTLLLVIGVAAAASSGGWSRALRLFVLLGLWGTLTAMLVRRLWPRGRLAELLEDPKHEHLERPVAGGGIILLVALVAAVVLVVASLYLA